jgi:hypothetical protein
MGGSLIGAAGSVLGGVAGGKGASKAAKAQAQAYQSALNQQQNQFNTIQNLISPNANAGNAATQQLLRLLGLGDMNTGQSVNGNPAYSAEQQQQGALDNLKNSPLFQGAYNTGADTILQNASATGGLRGGNTQNSLANFGSQLFSNVYQNDLSNLFGLAGVGQNAAGTLASAGQNFANQSSNLLVGQGNANAAGAAAPYAAFQNILGGLGNSGIFNGGGGSGGGVWNGSGSFPSGAYGW